MTDFLSLIGLHRSGDTRLQKAQLDFAAYSVQVTRFTSPFWAVVISLLCSGLTGLFGHRPPLVALSLPALVTAMTGAGFMLTARYLAEAPKDAAGIRLWSLRLAVLQMGISAGWGLMPWLLWEPGNMLNHVFLAAAVIAVMSGMVHRASNLALFAAALAPVSAMTGLRFAFGGGVPEHVLAAAAPLFALQMWLTSRSLLSRMQEDARLRFQVEDMAHELEQTRDEALRKRFEAEAANASKTAFLANMSHELRTPLNAILGFSEIISEECFGPVANVRYRDYAGDIHASGAHLLSLINDLLDVAKIEAGRMEISPHPLDPRKAFEIALKLIAFKASEKDQQLTIQVAPGTPPLYADERALKQMLLNLVSNAVKFTPAGGRIEVIASMAQGGGFQILVRDNGPGIPAERLANIFLPFAQVDNRYDRQAGGTGLGLALVRGLAELHGGRAWLESEPGQGCSAYIVLPVPVQASAVA